MDEWRSEEETADKLMNQRRANNWSASHRRVCQWCGRHKMERKGGFFICDTCDIPRGKETELSIDD